MKPTQCIETVTVRDLVPHVEKAAVTTFQASVAHNRYMTSVTLVPGLAASRYQTTMIVYADSTRRRHVSVVDYDVRMTPRAYSETAYRRPSCVKTTYGAIVQYYQGLQHR